MATIARETGVSKGNVSAYRNGKKPIPDNFLKTLYSKFGEPEKIDRQATAGDPEVNPGKEHFTADQLFAMFLQVSNAQTAILGDIKKEMAREKTQAKMEASLTEVLTGVETIALRQQKSFREILERIDRNPPSKGGGKK